MSNKRSTDCGGFLTGFESGATVDEFVEFAS
jgi:hypothetical protein